MLLTRRAVYVLACDASSFGGRGDDLYPEMQLEVDIDKLNEMGVCQWLQHLSWCVPGCDALLVATKCDLVRAEVARDTADRIEKACRTWLSRLTTPKKVNIDGGIILTSCEVQEHNKCSGVGVPGVDETTRRGQLADDWKQGTNEGPSVGLLYRLAHKHEPGSRRGERMVLPRGWNIAVVAVDALREGRYVFPF